MIARSAFDVMPLERFPRCQCVDEKSYNVWTESAILVGQRLDLSGQNSLNLYDFSFPNAAYASRDQQKTIEGT